MFPAHQLKSATALLLAVFLLNNLLVKIVFTLPSPSSYVVGAKKTVTMIIGDS